MSPDALGALARKYRTLGDLRRAKARGEAAPVRAVFKALAEEFPGALNELDMLPLDEIDRRAAALEAAATGAHEAWMAWLADYHALFRAALRIKLCLPRGRDAPEAGAARLAQDVSRDVGIDVDEEFVALVMRPPSGRIANVVFARIARRYEVDETQIRDALFPHRKKRRATGLRR
jgi:hypothetical protein